MNDILSMLRSMDKNQLEGAVKKAQEFSKTPQGKQVIDKLRKGESVGGIDTDSQNKILNELNKNPEIAQKISDILNGKG